VYAEPLVSALRRSDSFDGLLSVADDGRLCTQTRGNYSVRLINNYGAAAAAAVGVRCCRV